MYSIFARIICACALLVVIAPTARSVEPVPLGLTSDSELVFASRETGIAIMTIRDDYVSHMSRFDRMLRLRSAQPVSERAYLDYLAANVLDWTEADMTRLKPLVQKLRKSLQQFRLPLPSTILLIKTTGKEEVGPHTRSNAIVLPQSILGDDDESLLFLLSHELFHIMSRHDADFRRRAYALIGFRLGNEIPLPGSIAPLQITNPDAPRHDSYIDITNNGRKRTVVPVLLSRSAVFDPQIGMDLDQFWTLRLLVVEQVSPQAGFSAVEHNGAPMLLRLGQVDGFLSQVGKNTDYVIHPEEILADNFALLITGKQVREPARLEALRQLLARQKKRAQRSTSSLNVPAGIGCGWRQSRLELVQRAGRVAFLLALRDMQCGDMTNRRSAKAQPIQIRSTLYLSANNAG
jgi:hypothetical protein